MENDYETPLGEQIDGGTEGADESIELSDDADELEPINPCEDMDGDFDSAMASAGFGTDEDYGAGTHDWECGSEY